MSCNNCTNCTSCSGSSSTCTCTKTTDPCNTNCGCAVEVGAQCVRYMGNDLKCANISKGTLLETAMELMDTAICNKVGKDGTNGTNGKSISLIKFTSSTGTAQGQAGKVDTYTAYFDTAGTDVLGTFTVTNGNNGQSIALIKWTSSTGSAQAQAGQTDTYTIYSDTGGTNDIGTFQVKNGEDGKRIVSTYNNTTGVGNTEVNNDTNSLFSATLPANTLAADGEELELFTYMDYTASNTVNLEFQLDSTNKYTYAMQNAANTRFFFKVKISRMAVGSQLWTIEIISQTGTANAVTKIDVATTSFNLASAATFRIQAANANPGANQVVLKKATIYKNKS